jgi:hypothetical protein
MVSKAIIFINATCSIILLLQSLRLIGSGIKIERTRLTDWLSLISGSVLLGNTFYLATSDPLKFQIAILPLVVISGAYLKYNQFWPRFYSWRDKRRTMKGSSDDGDD